MAERQGFEPWEPRSSTVFKTAAFEGSMTIWLRNFIEDKFISTVWALESPDIKSETRPCPI